MTLFPTIRIVTLTLLATLVPAGYAAGAVQDTTLMGSIKIIPPERAIDRLIADAQFTHSSFETYQAAREQIHTRLQEMGFRPRWQQVADFETFTAWYSDTQNMTILCTEAAAPTGWMHGAYPMTGKLTRHDYFYF